jgi:hypothetical protein
MSQLLEVAMTDYKQRFDAIRGLSVQAVGDRPKVDIRAVKQGGYIEFGGDTFQIVKINRYLEVKWEDFSKLKKDYWVTELLMFNLLTGASATIEWEVDDELELSVTTQRLPLFDLSFQGKRLKYSDLEDIAEEEEGVVSFDGTKFHYEEDDTWAALFYEDNTPDHSQVRMMEFSDGGKTSLTVELWTDEGAKPDKEAFLSEVLKPSAVTVLQAGIASEVS